jgi:hypothetical protein
MNGSFYLRGRAIGTPVIIHSFAVAHAVVVWLSRIFNYVDDVPLTVLTLSMIVIISIRQGLKAEFVAALAIICSFVGYLLGIYGAQLIFRVVGNSILAPVITTVIITEMIGWLTYAFARNRPDRITRISWSLSTLQIILIAMAILLLRISYSLIFSLPYFEQGGIFPEFQRLFSNTFALITMLGGNIIFVNLRLRGLHRKGVRVAVSGVFIVLFSLLITAIVYYNLPWGNDAATSMALLSRHYAVVLLADIVVYAILQLIVSVIDSNTELRNERGKKHRVQYQYDRLKLQINPHFLFNSLNILDYLVQERHTERASAFIRKLADTYRYMLKNELETLVPLREELVFAQKYIDLLKERFTTGFTVEVSVPQPLLSCHVVPCCLQLLIENATKHNIISPENPLLVTIIAEGDLLTVSNNLQPRINAPASTGMGLKTIRQQYLDLSGKPIVVEQTKTTFRVKLPLL